MARFRGTISVDIPEGATRSDVAEYILDAVGTMKGSLQPPGVSGEIGDPLFDLDSDSIRLIYVDNGVYVEAGID